MRFLTSSGQLEDELCACDFGFSAETVYFVKSPNKEVIVKLEFQTWQLIHLFTRTVTLQRLKLSKDKTTFHIKIISCSSVRANYIILTSAAYYTPSASWDKPNKKNKNVQNQLLSSNSIRIAFHRRFVIIFLLTIRPILLPILYYIASEVQQVGVHAEVRKIVLDPNLAHPCSCLDQDSNVTYLKATT